jgi:hypothetical protein
MQLIMAVWHVSIYCKFEFAMKVPVRLLSPLQLIMAVWHVSAYCKFEFAMKVPVRLLSPLQNIMARFYLNLNLLADNLIFFR